MNDYSLIKDALDKSNNNTFLIVIIVLISINLAIEFIKFFLSVSLSKKDKKLKRLLLIDEKSLKVLEEIFLKLDSLTLLDKSDEAKLLIELKTINRYINQNKLYIPKKINKISIEIIDYFTTLLLDYSKKSVEKETEMFERYCNEFNK